MCVSGGWGGGGWGVVVPPVLIASTALRTQAGDVQLSGVQTAVVTRVLLLLLLQYVPRTLPSDTRVHSLELTILNETSTYTDLNTNTHTVTDLNTNTHSH